MRFWQVLVCCFQPRQPRSPNSRSSPPLILPPSERTRPPISPGSHQRPPTTCWSKSRASPSAPRTRSAASGRRPRTSSSTGSVSRISPAGRSKSFSELTPPTSSASKSWMARASVSPDYQGRSPTWPYWKHACRPISSNGTPACALTKPGPSSSPAQSATRARRAIQPASRIRSRRPCESPSTHVRRKPLYYGAALRKLARTSRDAKQVRRLLALAAIYEGETRSEAHGSARHAPDRARLGGAVQRRASGRAGRPQAAGLPPMLSADQRRALAEVVEAGPIPAARRRALALDRSRPMEVKRVRALDQQADAEPRAARARLPQAERQPQLTPGVAAIPAGRPHRLRYPARRQPPCRSNEVDQDGPGGTRRDCSRIARRIFPT